MNFNLPGWHLLGVFPEPDYVGSWLLHHQGEALLVEVPPGLTPGDVQRGLDALGATLLYVTASHTHEDHLDAEAWNDLIEAFPNAHFMCPSEFEGDMVIELSGEPVYFVKAPKHSPDDTVTVFRGVAMTGDIELGTLESVNDEVPLETKRASLDYLRGFEVRNDYRVHTQVSAHLNSLRENVDWKSLI